MTQSKSCSILRAPAWPTFARRLADAVTLHPGLLPAVDALLRPLRILDMIAAEAPHALGDDWLAVERVRIALQVAAPWQEVVKEVASLRSDRATSPYEPGVVHHGRLVLVALAAARVSAGHPPEAEAALRTVLGLALGAGAAEVLARSDPGQLGGGELGTLVSGLFARGALGEPGPLLSRAFAHDPVERGRWRCLFAALEPSAMHADCEGPWDGAYAEPIDDAWSAPGWPGTVHVAGRFAVEKSLLEKKKLDVVLASPGRPPAAVTPGAVTTKSFEVAVPAAATPGWLGFSSRKRIAEANAFREGVRARWAERSEVTAKEPYRELLRGAPVPVGLVPPLGPDLAAPPRTGVNRHVGGRPLVIGATVERDPAHPGQLELTWESAGATYVRLSPRLGAATDRLPPTGVWLVPTPVAHDVTYTLTPVSERSGDAKITLEGDPVALLARAEAPASSGPDPLRVTAITLGQLGGDGSPPYVAGAPIAVEVSFEPASSSPAGRLIFGGQPLETVAGRDGRLELTLPGDRVVPGRPLTFGVEVGSDGLFFELGPYVVRGARELGGVILVRPAARRSGEPAAVGAEEARSAVLSVCKGMNIRIAAESIRELPWVDDPLAVLSDDVHSAEDPRVPRLLEHLSRAAARTPGFEDALWLLLVPDERGAAARPRAGFESHLPAEAALAVSVANPAGLELLFSRLFPLGANPPEGRPSAARLRLVGTLDPSGAVSLDPSREEVRRAGPGAPIDSGIVAVSSDAEGHELRRVPVKTFRDALPAGFALLLPVSPEVSAVELRCDDRVLCRVTRPSGSPRLALTRATPDGDLEWSYAHPGSCAPTFEIELSDGAMGTPMLALGACARSLAFPVHRTRGEGLAVRLVASDGWNTDAATLDLRPNGDGLLVARRVRSGEFWADTDLAGTLAWTLDGKEIGRGRVLLVDPSTLPEDARGAARTLTVRETDGPGRAADSRRFGGTDG